jgi:hypothetical protein
MGIQASILAATSAESIFDLCNELSALPISTRQKSLVTLTVAAWAGQETLRKHLNVAHVIKLDDSILASAASHLPGDYQLANYFDCIMCGLASRLVHRCFVYANDRKIMGKLLLEYQMTLAKLAEMTTLEAILCLRLRISVFDQTADHCENHREICRVSLRISALAMELMAGAAFVQEDSRQSDQEVFLLTINTTLTELCHAQHP